MKRRASILGLLVTLMASASALSAPGASAGGRCVDAYVTAVNPRPGATACTPR